MASKKRSTENKNNTQKMVGIINGAGEIVEQKIVKTIQENYMPYAMSVIMSRAIPEIDGFKPSHRKLLYTMYKMGLLTSQRTKSANIVGQTMKLNPHGDNAIYDTMVRLSRGYEALLHPYVDSKGNFGKYYSRDMAWAASRYTEAKLDAICNELFRDIDKDTVDFVDNYDNTLKEPTLLPATYPSILVNANTGIAVGMASSICPFNLKEVCDTTIELIKNPDHNIVSTLLAPDFPGGGNIIYNADRIEEIYKTGRGSIKIRSRYMYDKSANCIDVTSIPPTTTAEAIIEKVIDLVKQGKIREISDIRDETGLEGLKITIDLKRSVNPDRLMQKLFRMTTLEDTFSCNFNVLISSVPKVLGVWNLLDEWIAFRTECVQRRTQFDLNKKKDKLHLLNALEKILFDIDKAIKIIRHTEEETEVIPNLMIGFGIDEIQSEYVAEIKLRHLNREYILKRTNETEQLRKDIEKLKDVLSSKSKIKEIIIDEMQEVSKKYSRPRKSMLIYPEDINEDEVEEELPDYPVNLFFTKDGYCKKITPGSLRMSADQKLKENDRIIQTIETTNNSELLFFTDKLKAYKSKVSDFSDTKASLLGEYVPAKLSMDENENAIYMVNTKDYLGNLLFFFENGKVAKVTLKSYETKTNRKKLINAYSNKSVLTNIIYSQQDVEYLLISSDGRMLLFHSGAIQSKSTKNTQGITVINLKKESKLIKAKEFEEGEIIHPDRYRTKNIPALGTVPQKDDPIRSQLKM